MQSDSKKKAIAGKAPRDPIKQAAPDWLSSAALAAMTSARDIKAQPAPPLTERPTTAVSSNSSKAGYTGLPSLSIAPPTTTAVVGDTGSATAASAETMKTPVVYASHHLLSSGHHSIDGVNSD
jgi:hypothetical protein